MLLKFVFQIQTDFHKTSEIFSITDVKLCERWAHKCTISTKSETLIHSSAERLFLQYLPLIFPLCSYIKITLYITQNWPNINLFIQETEREIKSRKKYVLLHVSVKLKLANIPHSISYKKILTFRRKKGLIFIITQNLFQTNLMSVKHWYMYSRDPGLPYLL